MSVSIDQQFVEYIVKGLVGKPEAVKVERSIDEKGVLLELTVDPEDLGRVIGKRGNTAQSIRTLLRALGTKNDARYNLKIVDNGEPRPARPEREDRTESADVDEAGVSEDAVNPETPSAAPVSPWAHLSSSNDDTSTDDTSDEDDKDEAADEEETSDENSVVEKTRKELEDLDDLDI